MDRKGATVGSSHRNEMKGTGATAHPCIARPRFFIGDRPNNPHNKA